MTKYFLIICFIMAQYAVSGQEEHLQVESAIVVSDNINPTPVAGTIQWSGSDFEGWNGERWVSLSNHAVVGSVTDIDGNTYKTARIGNEEWMTENLRVTRYNDGTPLNFVNNAQWQFATDPAYGWYNNDEESYDLIYGKIYNGHVLANGNKNVCPEGWFVPLEEDWLALTTPLSPRPWWSIENEW